MRPVGWSKTTGGRWSDSAKTGEQSIGGLSDGGSPLWMSDPIDMESGQSYRFGGWISAISGAARLRPVGCRAPRLCRCGTRGLHRRTCEAHTLCLMS